MNKQDILKIVEDAMEDALYVKSIGYGEEIVAGKDTCLKLIAGKLNELFNNNDLSKF